jgi:hypothetical protein
MLTIPLHGARMPPGVLQALDRRDGRPYTHEDLDAGVSAAELVRLALDSGEEETTLLR